MEEEKAKSYLPILFVILFSAVICFVLALTFGWSFGKMVLWQSISFAVVSSAVIFLIAGEDARIRRRHSILKNKERLAFVKCRHGSTQYVLKGEAKLTQESGVSFCVSYSGPEYKKCMMDNLQCKARIVNDKEERRNILLKLKNASSLTLLEG